MRLRTLVLALCLLAAPAFGQTAAQNAWIVPGTNSTADAFGNAPAPVVEQPLDIIAYSFDENVATGSYIGFSCDVTCACFHNPDVGGTSGTGVVVIDKCIDGNGTKDANTCFETVDTLSDAASDYSVALEPRSYAFRVSTDPTAGEDALFFCVGY